MPDLDIPDTLKPSMAGSYPGFPTAAKAVLQFLNNRIGMGLWMVTRANEHEWIVLHSVDSGYGVCDGQVLRWSDSFCSRMVQGLGPRVAADSSRVPAYCQAPIAQQLALPIGSYIGVPLMNQDGSLFGTLCAISPTAQPQKIEQEQPLIELLSCLLSTILSRELCAADALRQAEMSNAQALRDPLTALFNRRGFDQLAAREEARCDRFGHDACVLSIDLNELKQVNDELGHAAGDQLLRLTAGALGYATRNTDIVARTGGDEFVIVAPECGLDSGSALMQRVESELRSSNVSASIGLARRLPGDSIGKALKSADAAMYEAKRKYKARKIQKQCA